MADQMPDPTPLTSDLLRNRTRGISEEERRVIEASIAETRQLSAGEIAVRQDVEATVSLLLVEGFMTRYIDAADGRRHLVALHVPGDFVDLHAYALGYLDHDVGALTASTLAVVPHTELERIQHEHPALARRLWFAALLDAAMHRQWSYRLSNLSAIQRVSHFLCETHARLLAIGRARAGNFLLPMTQSDIGEVCGLTNVHVNRVLRQLREAGLCTVRSQRVDITDLKGLATMGNFLPDYLYLNDRLMLAAVGQQEFS